uniref:thymidine kinase n=1 Tax=viral metagenome TaxID=1070528 RepID=A0A6C0CM52_9ZZZZ
MPLKVIIGGMFSGKTTELQRVLRRYRQIDEKILVVKHQSDTRYDNGDTLTSHNDETETCISVSHLMALAEEPSYESSYAVFIDEGQFFPDLLEFIKLASMKDSKYVYVAGLDATYEQKPFGQMLDIIPYAEKVQKLASICSKCKKPAGCSKRISDINGDILIGGKESYVAICAKCLHSS